MANPVGRPRKKPLLNRPSGQPMLADSVDFEAAPNFDLLSYEERTALRTKAKENVDKRERARALEAFLADEEARIERELHPEAYEEERTITIDLAVYADRIVIDGKHYMHGRTYKVKKSLYDSMQDIMARTHRHYADTHRDPAKVMMEAAQQIAKGGKSYATVNGSTGNVTRF